GPDGGTPGKPVGTLCIGLAGPQAAEAFRFHFTSGRRLANKTLFAMQALDLLRRALLEAAG
ncbi:MAG: CinA family protein, partial [Desulfobacteraceae bacterium]